MGKTKDKTKTKAAAKAPAGDIDDIFAKPAKAGKAGKPTKAAGDNKKRKDKAADVVDAAKKKKKSKGKEKERAGDDVAEGSGADKATKSKSKKSEPKTDATPVPSRAVVEVVDPSVAVHAALDRSKEKEKERARSKKRDRNAVEEDKAFRDSRGDGNRRTTEEGFFIFKEAELGIDPEAGGTALCPFDCDCCF